MFNGGTDAQEVQIKFCAHSILIKICLIFKMNLKSEDKHKSKISVVDNKSVLHLLLSFHIYTR